MLNGVGFIIILVCVFGSFVMAGGKMGIILHALPHEMMMIAGAAVGASIVSNSMRKNWERRSAGYAHERR